MMKAYIVSLGCNKNLVDSEIMAGYIKKENIVSDPEQADVIIVNTCGFIEPAKVEAVDTILEMAQYKKKGKCKSLIVSGCLAQRYPDAIFDMEEVDAVIGTYYYENINRVISATLSGTRIKDVSGTATYLDNVEERVVTTKPYAYLKIAEGCDNKCAYCAIPGIRGKYVSRTQQSLIKEAEKLKAEGIKELIVTAQDTTRFGIDRGNYELAELLEKLANMGFEWIRIMYAYPSTFTEDIIAVMEKHDNICKYVDIPIQHTEDKMLSLMNRHYCKDDVIAIMKRLRNSSVEWSVRTTLMCGFPGETEKEHREMLKFIKQYKFDNLGVFAFSCEEGTEAETMKHPCRENTKQRRCDEIMLTQAQIVDNFAKRHIGKQYKTLVEGFDNEQNMFFGRNEFLAPEVDGKVFFCGENIKIGEFCVVEITDVVGYDFYGRVL